MKYEILRYTILCIGGMHLSNFLALCVDYPGTRFMLIIMAFVGGAVSIVPWMRANGEWIFDMKMHDRFILALFGVCIKAGLMLAELAGHSR
ncbi:hypothetical protein [Nostoc linckia]|uniref:hypothetical protein n=1 Tax=Nostoc linckia TaxID=92942 RepID=UPI00117DDC63|nr:hypothetical protein [Nostoc linckia]